MTINVHPEDLASVLANLQGRLQKLESYPPGAMRLLAGSTGASANGLPFTLSPTDIAATRSNTFTVIRPTPILMIGLANFYTSGGSANYGLLSCPLEDSGPSQAFDYFNGESIISPQGVHTNGAGVSSQSIAAQGVVGPGTYSAVLTYYMDVGAATTMSIYSWGFSIFVLGG